MNLHTATAALVRLSNQLEDAVINSDAREMIRLAVECRDQATDIDREITSRRVHAEL